MLGSEIDDANIETGDSSEFAIKAKEVALVLLNKERGTLCPDRPALQFLTTLAASVQVVQGYFVRLILELREASETFAEMAFTADIAIVYTLDADVPGQTTVSPVIYPADPPCQMMFRIPSKNDPTIKHKGQRRLDFTNRTAIHARGLAASATALGPLQPAPVKELDKLTALASADPPRLRRQPHRGQNETLENDAVNTTLSLDLAGMLSVGSKFIVRPPVKKFVEANLDIPDNYDPRIARTLCFPRGINRRQGSCGSSWAFAATSVAGFRQCLRNLKHNSYHTGLSFFSAQELVSCAADDGCAGGNANSAFSFMHSKGLPIEDCSPYRMRCFADNSMVSTESADRPVISRKMCGKLTSASPCKCLPRAFHFSAPIECELLPAACERVKAPHYYYMRGTAAGSTVPKFERMVKQEVISLGPVYVSVLIYQDFFDPVCWTESGIYIHREGSLVGKHAVALVGWGTDADGRDYWLLFNSFGAHWQQEGYFRIERGDTALQMARFGAYAPDFSSGRDMMAPLLSASCHLP
jgi:hypothetical protein